MTGAPVRRAPAPGWSTSTNPTPAGLAYLNLALASVIPLDLARRRGCVHGLRPRWLASVRPRIRWRSSLACLGRRGRGAARHAGRVGVAPVLGEQPATSAATSTPSPDHARLLLVVLLLTPLQAAGEEYVFRGYLTQAFGGLFRRALGRRSWCPALLFALAHGSARASPVFFDRFAFGLVAGVLVVLTGGLEAGIAMHVLNNWLAFGLALAFGDMASTLNPTGGSWWSIPVTLTQSLVYLGLACSWPAGWGSRPRPTAARFGGAAEPRVRFPGGRPPALRPSAAGRERPSTIGIWCNWQHDWFWSS